MSIASRIERIPDNRYYKKLLVLGGLGYTFEAMDGAVIAFVLAAIIKPWHLSAAKTGILGSALLIGFFIGAFLSGYIGDRIGRKKVIIWTLVIYSVASLISALRHQTTRRTGIAVIITVIRQPMGEVGMTR